MVIVVLDTFESIGAILLSALSRVHRAFQPVLKHPVALYSTDIPIIYATFSETEPENNWPVAFGIKM